jgi:catechol 2,3-dioxygenase-like lactoylglutathione lyase family enzyme
MFYEGLGFVVDRQLTESGEFISHVVGIPNVKIETVKMKSPDGGLIELLQYLTIDNDTLVVKQFSNQLGCSHLAMTVHSIDEFCVLIQNLGGSVVNSPIKSHDGKVSVAYCHDNEGILLEIVQEF